MSGLSFVVRGLEITRLRTSTHDSLVRTPAHFARTHALSSATWDLRPTAGLAASARVIATAASPLPSHSLPAMYVAQVSNTQSRVARTNPASYSCSRYLHANTHTYAGLFFHEGITLGVECDAVLDMRGQDQIYPYMHCEHKTQMFVHELLRQMLRIKYVCPIGRSSLRAAVRLSRSFSHESHVRGQTDSPPKRAAWSRTRRSSPDGAIRCRTSRMRWS